MSIPHFDESIVINRPVDEVVAFATDWFNAPRDGSVLAFRQTKPGPPGVGTTFEGRRVILGFETRFKTRLTEWDPPHTVAATSEGGPFRSLVFLRDFRGQAGWDQDGRVSGPGAAPSAEAAWAPRRALLEASDDDCQKNFKRLVEAQPR